MLPLRWVCYRVCVSLNKLQLEEPEVSMLRLGLLLLTGACAVWQSGEHFPSLLPPEFLP